jgi:hypothetical protein
MNAIIVVAVNTLPLSVQSTLRQIGYGKKDISVYPSENVSPQGAGGDGFRCIFAMVKMSDQEEQATITCGSWGGSNMFNPENIVDLMSESITIPEGVCAIKATAGGNHPMTASLHISPANCAKMLPEGEVTYTSEEKAVLRAFAMTGSYRKEQLLRIRNSEQVIAGLIEKGLVEKKGSGRGLSIAGKNALNVIGRY